MSDKERKTEDIVFFVIDSDSERRSFYMSVCQMVRGVRVFGFETGEDAVSYSERQSPDAAVVAYSLNGELEGIETVRKIISLNENAAIAAIADVYNKTVEDEILSAGAISCLSMSLRNDSQLYAMKSLADLAKSKRSNGHPLHINPFNTKATFEIINIKSYHAANVANKCASVAALSSAPTNKLLYIRVLSFLYDFFIKCFINDVDITAGIAIDNKRLIIAVPLNEKSENLMKSAVFYFIAKKFIETDGLFMAVTLELGNKALSEYCHAEYKLDTLDGETLDERINSLKHNLKSLKDRSELFGKFLAILELMTAITDTAATKDTLDKISTLFDEINKYFPMDTFENKLFTHLTELCIIIKKQC